MDLLFENGRYEDVIKVMDEVKDRRVAGYKFPNDCLVLLAASCCKLVRDSSEKSVDMRSITLFTLVTGISFYLYVVNTCYGYFLLPLFI